MYPSYESRYRHKRPPNEKLSEVSYTLTEAIERTILASEMMSSDELGILRHKVAMLEKMVTALAELLPDEQARKFVYNATDFRYSATEEEIEGL